MVRPNGSIMRGSMPAFAAERHGIGREPVAEDLIFGVGGGADTGKRCGIDFAVFLQRSDCLARPAFPFNCNSGTDLAFEARTVFEYPLDFVSGVVYRIHPANPRVHRM